MLSKYTYIYIHTPIFCWAWHKYIHMYIKSHGSESRGQEEAGLHNEPVSYVFTGSTAVKLVNTLNKPP